MSTTTVQPKHNKTTDKGIAMCEAVGVEFWALAPGAGRYWGILDGQMFRVVFDRHRRVVYSTPCTHQGLDIGKTTTHPAPADI